MYTKRRMHVAGHPSSAWQPRRAETHNKYELRPEWPRLSPHADCNFFRDSRQCIPDEQRGARVLGSKRVQIRRVLRRGLPVVLAMRRQPESRAGRGSWVFFVFNFIHSQLYSFSPVSRREIRLSQVCGVSATSSAGWSVSRTAIHSAPLAVPTWLQPPMGRIASYVRTRHANALRTK